MDTAVQKSIALDLALIDHYDRLLNDVELYIVKTAKQDDVHALYRLRSVPGIGKILALVILIESDPDRGGAQFLTPWISH
ncbi:MAG: hypothetical protein ACREV3_04295 [Gammaproteobacteria bacterium]